MRTGATSSTTCPYQTSMVRKFWRVFWYARLGVAAYLTYRAYQAVGHPVALLKEVTIITVWTMWTADLPNGKETE